MSYKAIIIDDESKLRKVLEIKVQEIRPDLKIVAMASNADEGEKLIRKHDPDLIFLDIHMPGDSGFELLERFEQVNFEIIFVTGYNEFALRALKVSAVDYILKPATNEDLKQAISKALDRIDEKVRLERYEILKHNIKNIDTEFAKIVIPGAKLYQHVLVNDIIHCEGWQKYTRIHLKNGDIILSSYNIGVFKDLLKEYNFFSPHKSHLINMNAIKNYNPEGIVELINGNEVPVSRRRKADFLNRV